ncbi:unnamed protein product [Rotaria sordida]|uniref:Uncharacterized protein n=1 Tax=Rotaria sordida TaxID=392033 RepID=A0A818S9D2_9BILA|nr:unnamed protein product [Rotaria sordida]CAF0785138.1 unnamed protein product [Rotaria sordida]CAF3665680.1 unnamed protein product [Rotaria sordida]CAF3875624.1 unnamed protein product [Rotaria sordida]
MEEKFFPTRALFWSFWANIIFTFGMIGYFLMDGLDYVYPNTLNSSLSAIIYVILAGVFVIDCTLQLIVVYNIDRNIDRYIFMVVSCIFDKVGSHAYLLGALFTATNFTSTNTVLIFNRIGVIGFAIGAAINMIVPGSSILYSWANSLNLLGSLLYVLAIIIIRVPLTQIIVILGDFIYIIDAILYMICWFSDRRLAMKQGEQILLLNKESKTSSSNSEMIRQKK